MKTTKSPALTYISHAWASIPRDSWQRLNGGMHSALRGAIRYGMEFHPQDIRYLYENFRAHYWIGHSDEGLYALACSSERGSENTSAAIAFETYWKRPAYLWPEATKTPARLYVGAQLTWQGHLVTVTSFSAGQLIACSYERGQPDEKTQVGSVIYAFDAYRRIEAAKEHDGQIMARFSARCEQPGEKLIRRFKVPHEELMAVRKAYDQRRRHYEKLFAAAQSLKELDEINAQFQAEGRTAFRHFDIEAIRAAYQNALSRVKQAMSAKEQAEYQRQQALTHDADLERWCGGEDVRRHFNIVKLRIKDGWVETSTMQRATLQGARLALRFVKKHRAKGWQQNGQGFNLDQFPVVRVDQAEVVIGCTDIPWTEIDRIAPQLQRVAPASRGD